MNATGTIVCMALCAFAVTTQAQECSGGSDGGADAAGSQCNRVFTPPEDAGDLRRKAMDAYERGDYDATVQHLRRAAERGDVRAAELIVLMHRYNKALYGGRVSVGDAEAKHWAGIVARASAATLAGRQAR